MREKGTGKSSKGEGGFTIIEMLVALTLLEHRDGASGRNPCNKPSGPLCLEKHAHDGAAGGCY